jgi:rhodanese-related sulfurtransferase
MTLKRILFLILSLSLVVFMSCSSDDGDDPPTEPGPTEAEMLQEVGDLYYTAYTTITGRGVNTTMQTVFDNLTDGDDSNNPQIIDWRSSADYDLKHIKGAINISLGDLVDKVEDGTIDKSKEIVNVCYSGQSASIATATLNMLGYDAQNLKFGMCGVTNDTNIVKGTHRWDSQIAEDDYTLNKTDEGAPTTEYTFPVIETGAASAEEVIKNQFSNTSSGWGVGFGDIKANPEDFFIINYWSASEYMNPGHIEGAYQFTPKSSLKSDEMLKYLPTDKTIAVYCYTGQTSAQIAAYLRMLGYDAKSIFYGVNGFAHDQMLENQTKYHAPDPADKYVSVLE